MGGTLPLLVAYFHRLWRDDVRSTAWIYSINTLGAAFGCYLAGFHLLPALDLSMANSLTAAASLLVGVSAVVLHSRTSLQQSADATPVGEIEPRDALVPATPCRATLPDATVLAIATLTGFGSLVLEMIWTRQLGLILGGSAYAFTAMLFVVLVGIALGSLIVSGWSVARHAFLPCALVVALLMSIVAGQLLIPGLSALVGALRGFRVSPVSNALLCVAVSGVLEFLPAVAMGCLFPLLVGMTRGDNDAPGRVGRLYAWNTLGAIAGGGLTFSLFVPAWGMATTLGVALLAWTVAALLLVPDALPRALPLRLATLGVGVVGMLACRQGHDPRETDFGMYLYGAGDQYAPDSPVKTLLFREGSACNVLVTEVGGHRALRVNGKVDASTGVTDMQTQLGLALFPRIFLPEAKSVLVIGLGCGMTSGASARFPNTDVVCCEIEPAVSEAARLFSDVNFRPHESPRFSLVFDDARSYVHTTRKTFDLIISEPSNPWMDGVAALYTVEHFRAARSKMTPDGLYAQWIHTYGLGPDDLALVLRTMAEVFENLALVEINEGDLLILATNGSTLDVEAATLDRAQRTFAPLGDVVLAMKKQFNTTDLRALLTRQLVLSPAEVRVWTGESYGRSAPAKPELNPQAKPELNTDQNLRLGWSAARQVFEPRNDRIRATVWRRFDPAACTARFRRQGCGQGQLAELARVSRTLASFGRDHAALAVAEFGLEVDVKNAELRCARLVASSRLSDKLEAAELRELAETCPVELNQAAVMLWKSRRFDAAAELLEAILDKHPTAAMALRNLATVYESAGRRPEASTIWRRLAAFDPSVAPPTGGERKVADSRPDSQAGLETGSLVEPPDTSP